MFSNYVIVKSKNIVKHKKEFAYKTLQYLDNDCSHKGDDIEEGILSVFKDKDTEDKYKNPTTWKLTDTDFYVLKTESNLFNINENENFEFYNCSKKEWKKFFKDFLFEKRILDFQCSILVPNSEEINIMLDKVNNETTTETDLNKLIDLYNNMIDNEQNDIDSCSLWLKYNTPEGDISFEITPSLIIKSKPFYCNNLNKSMDKEVLYEYALKAIKEITVYFNIVKIKKKYNLHPIDISENIMVEHPLKNSLEIIQHLFKNSFNELELPVSEINMVESYFKEYANNFTKKKIYPWDAREIKEKYLN